MNGPPGRPSCADSGVTFPYVLHTTDGGATWFTQTLPAEANFGLKSVKGVSRSEAWASTLDGVILRTTNGGATWTVIPHPGIVITQVNRMDVILPHIWLADSAEDGAIIHSADGGATWRREVMDNEGEVESPLTVHAVSPDVVWASGTRSLSFFRAVDGGATWEKVITVGGFDHLDDICASSAADVWGAQNGDGVNGHIHWVDAPPDGAVEHGMAAAPALQGYTPGGVSCVDSRTAWVVAPKGVPPDPAKPRADHRAHNRRSERGFKALRRRTFATGRSAWRGRGGSARSALRAVKMQPGELAPHLFRYDQEACVI
jgi:hypothetical protein